ncbi:MAG: DNA translocase FtsK [Dehalococcoidia bacterium]|nr:DNA translocase FtsK [Dehalococcoidia bacterium]
MLAAGLVISIAWVVLLVSGTAFDTLGRFRESVFRMVGFGSVLIVGWVAVFVFALAFRRHWFRRYNLWLASAAAVVAAMGALSFLSPSEGLLGWFALGGEVTPGGQVGDMIIGSGGWTGWLRVVAALAVAGALFVLPAFQAVGDALLSLINRRRQSMLAAPPMEGPVFEDQEDDSRTPPVAVMGVSGGAARSGVEPSSWYTSSEPMGARGAPRVSPDFGSDAPSEGPSFTRPRETFDFRNSPIRSAPVPSLANYLDGMTGSGSVETRIRSALAAPPEPEPEPAVNEPGPYEDGDPFKPLNLSKLPEPVFAFGVGTEAVAVAEQEEAPETPDVESLELPDSEEIEDPLEEAYDEPEVESIDDEEFDADLPEEPSLSVPEATASEPAIVVDDSDSGQDDFFMSEFDSAPAVVEAGNQPSFSAPYIEPSSDSTDFILDDSTGGGFPTSEFDSASGDGATNSLLEYDDSDRGDFLAPDLDSLSDEELSDIPRNEDGSDAGDSLSNLDSSATIVDVSDQPSFDGAVVETTSMSDSEPESVIMEDFDPDYLAEVSPPTSAPAQPSASFKTNKYWAIGSNGSPPESEPPSLAFDRGEEAGSSPVTVPVAPAAWRKPSIRMLNTASSNSITPEEQRDTADAITRTLADYGIEVGVKDIRPGPTVTMYGLTPGWVRKQRTVKQVDASGTPLKDERGRLVTKQVEEKTRVKVDSILAREKDLSLALKTPSIRLETPAMGKSLIGIEVPNPNPSLVTLRSIMESPVFQDLQDGDAHLPVALGQGSGGEPVVFDLAKMPHLLVAGATGSGKSVCLNAIVSCLITEKTPDEMRMLLVDPKRVELTPYNGVPHLLAPVIVETDTVVGYLKGLIREMFDRYRRMEEVGVRNIEAYNERMPDKMPFLCVVIDELADLMMTAAVDVEQSICRLAQLGRATGIHMIIATQRPSVDVLTGLIKANFPSRISFGVTSQVDSRTILDTGGADKLLGRGDMLYLPLDASKPSRVQSVFIGDSEIEKLVDFWQSAPRLPLDEIDLLGGVEEEVGDVSVEDDPDRDEMIDKAIEIALSHRKLSTSLLQRRLRIGYPRAARLMDQLEDEGIVGPGDGSKSRDVIMNQN